MRAHTLTSHKAETPVGLTESNSEGSHRFSPPHSYSQAQLFNLKNSTDSTPLLSHHSDRGIICFEP